MAETELGQDTSGNVCPTPSTSNSNCNNDNPTGQNVAEGGSNISTASLWVVIISSIVTAVLLALLLFYLKRRNRRRRGEHIRALLWRAVRGIEEGTIDPMVLDQLMYGSSESAPHRQAPKLFEVPLPGRCGKVDSLENPSNDAWKWGSMRPVSLAPPYAIDIPRPPPPKKPILQWPWRHPHALPPKVQTEKNTDHHPKDHTITTRHVDAAFLIIMPRTTSSNTNNHASPAFANCVVALASASPSFQDNLLDPAVPSHSHFSGLLGTRTVNPVSSPSGADRPRVNSEYAIENAFNRNNRNREPSTRPQWARRGLDGGTAAG